MSYHHQPSITTPLTGSATFLVLAHQPSSPLDRIRKTLADIDGLAKNIAIRDIRSDFACTVGIGADIWDRLTTTTNPTTGQTSSICRRPPELKPLPVLRGAVHATVSTPGDLLFHIRSHRRDLCFEFERQLLKALGDSVRVVDATVGFRYFDARDLLGFVDGTANPVGERAVVNAAVLGEGDVDGLDGEIEGGIGGGYVVVQKYLHNLDAWNALSTEEQEGIIGRTKFDNVELDDAEEGQRSHKTLTTIEDEEGNEHEIVRDNMPFGSPAGGEYGTYFIGYSKRLWVIERMLERMFVGFPEGKHDRILDFSTPVTGTTFFVPPVETLQGLGG
ncbi:uncharacterized protein C8A04DRAFT_15122 [Dichotomopilus funicola]|uniref:Dyp-type peroxidase n=1 Tax=Dichotomopilus funicola TaxID=1934379 RepID=A0AAN6UXD5_9PEZI|nr:hypothetical protein C8A04DRAFT_15122 [Dichotomopilus funicola]